MGEDLLLEVSNLGKSFRHGGSLRRRPQASTVALDGVSLSVGRDEVLGVVGESGSGKSTLARALVRLVQPDVGTVRFEGVDVLSANAQSLRTIRRRMQLIYQDPFSALNPRLSVGRAVGEAARVHGLVSRAGEAHFVADLLERVGLPERFASQLPHQLSGGQRQRVAIARALAVSPDLLLADEPTSALDVSIQAQVLNLFMDLRRERRLSAIFISHQLSVIARVADRVIVMYLGRIVEEGVSAEVFGEPRHPYTVALLRAHPSLQRAGQVGAALSGEIPSPSAIPTGCRFRTRCPLATEACSRVDPEPVTISDTHRAWCLYPDRVAASGGG